MAAVRLVAFVVFFSVLWMFVLTYGETYVVTVRPGRDAILHCQFYGTGGIEWLINEDPDFRPIRVFMVFRKRAYEEYQHRSYRGRVELRDPEMKNGDASVILKNVTVNDTGIYRCRRAMQPICYLQKIVYNISTVNLTVSDSEPEEVTAWAGDNVTLHCQGPRNASISVLKWIRTDLESDQYVFVRGNSSNQTNQLPSYRGRVELMDPEIKNGDASVILKNVTINDTGTYECEISTEGSEDGGTKSEFTLKVTAKYIWANPVYEEEEYKDVGNKEDKNKDAGNKEDENEEEGNTDGRSSRRQGPLVVGLSIGFIVLVIAVVVVVVVRFRGRGKYEVILDNNSAAEQKTRV